MEIELISEESFTVAANGKQISGMRVVSEWMFGAIIGKKMKTAMVVMGSPDLIAALSPEKPSNAELRGDPPALSAERPSSNDVL